MAEMFKFELVSPERLLISEEVQQVVVPGSEGDFAVLPNHAPILSTLRPGILEVAGERGENRRIYVRGGFAEAGPDSLTVLAQQAVDVKDLSGERLEHEIASSKKEFEEARDDEARRFAQSSIDQLSALKAPH